MSGKKASRNDEMPAKPQRLWFLSSYNYSVAGVLVAVMDGILLVVYVANAFVMSAQYGRTAGVEDRDYVCIDYPIICVFLALFGLLLRFIMTGSFIEPMRTPFWRCGCPSILFSTSYWHVWLL
jgi:hypothetical protein